MEEYIREQLPNNVSMSDSVSLRFISMFNEMRLNLEDDDTFYHAFPKNLQNEDTEKLINIEDDNEALEAIVDEEMEKDRLSESEACVIPCCNERRRYDTSWQIPFQERSIIAP